MKHFCIIANRAKDENKEYTNRIAGFLQALGCSVYAAVPIDPAETERDLTRGIPPETEAAIVLGGDGTFLHAAKALEPLQIPVLGINLGNLGFLTTSEIHTAEPALRSLVQDAYTIQKLPLLTAGKKGGGCWYAMNDVVISRSGYSRLLHFQVFVNGEMVGDYQSDGVIVSTPTGSTGYSMSAGGPLVSPDVRLLLITPICPHSLHARPLVVAADAEITVRLLPTFRSRQEEALVTVDGDEYGTLSAGEECAVRTSDRQISVLRLAEVTFWDRVRGKLQHSER
ncbi:MAG: NAD(+)/NADH kinase [Lachnospiraceae bacterium]|nr:NAD(+)/NADH kinase [Lachnospiraceae bacterium]